ncbi:MAG: arylsulfatase, partial [Planctomycetota bacterium]
GVRWGKWKLVREYRKPWELYDLDADRTERRDISRSESTQTTEMAGLWEAWARENDVAFPERFNMYEYLKRKGKQND